MKQKWVVRIVISQWERDERGGPLFGELIENLRYCGMLHVVRTDNESICFDLKVQPSTNEHAKRIADRFQSFGWNAVAAPEDK